MRGETELGVAVHLTRANLDFDRPTVGRRHHGVQRLVVIALGLRDVVIEFMRHWRPHGMHHTEHGVAIFHVIDQHAQCAHIEELGELQPLVSHLVPDAENVFGAAKDLGLDVSAGQLALEPLAGVCDELLAFGATLVDQFGDAFVSVRLEIEKRAVFKLPFELPHAEAIGERRVDIERFARGLGALGAGVIGIPAQSLGARCQTQ